MTRKRKLAIGIPAVYLTLLFVLTSVSHYTDPSPSPRPVAAAPSTTHPVSALASASASASASTSANTKASPTRSALRKPPPPDLTVPAASSFVLKLPPPPTIKSQLVAAMSGLPVNAIRHLSGSPWATARVEDTTDLFHHESTGWVLVNTGNEIGTICRGTGVPQRLYTPLGCKAAPVAPAPSPQSSTGEQGGFTGVTTAPAPPTSCTTTSSGSCIRGGEFCPESDEGQQGTDEGGDVLTCEADGDRDRWKG